mgnify:CR=1 FL=1
MTESERRQIIELIKKEVIPAIGCTEHTEQELFLEHTHCNICISYINRKKHCLLPPAVPNLFIGIFQKYIQYIFSILSDRPINILPSIFHNFVQSSLPASLY